MFRNVPACFVFRVLSTPDFTQEVKSRGGTLVSQVTRSRKVLEIYSQYARKISICLNRGREESVGNDDVSNYLRPQMRNG